MRKCPTVAKSSEPKFFIKFECKSESIATHWGTDIKRKLVAWIAIYTDILTGLAFLIAIIWVRSRVMTEVRNYKKKALQLGDFAVEIKHLPKLAICSNADQLKAKLALHIA